MFFRQLFDRESCTYTYVIGDEKSKRAFVIDPVLELVDRDVQLLNEWGYKPKYILETHIHADHITGSAKLKEHFPDLKSVVSADSDADADMLLLDGDILSIGDIAIQALATPGHTNTCMSYYLQDRVFTGDTLLIRGCGRTDFQSGDAGTLYDSITHKLFSLPDETLVFPAHNYKGMLWSTIGEEKAHNPRLARRSREDFIEIMNNLDLPQPAKIDVAVPANLKCGQV